MSPAPPPPPPGSAPVLKAEISVPVNLPNKSALLKSIEKGTKLKKTVTNDRSAPLVGSQANKAASNSESRTNSPASNGANVAAAASAAVAGMGAGLFANGFPKLRSVGGTASSAAKETIAPKQVESVKPAVNEPSPIVKPAKVTPPKVAHTNTAAAKPPPLPKKAPKQTFGEDGGDSTTSITRAMASTTIKQERWKFPSENTLPAPRKFTGCKKVYLSAQESSDSGAKSGDELSMDDLNDFISSLNNKLNAAVNDENFEECVRIKGKLKRLNTLKEKLKLGESVYTSDLPK